VGLYGYPIYMVLHVPTIDNRTVGIHIYMPYSFCFTLPSLFVSIFFFLLAGVPRSRYTSYHLMGTSRPSHSAGWFGCAEPPPLPVGSRAGRQAGLSLLLAKQK
jgi:hypothetical protein